METKGPDAGSAAGPRLHCAHYSWQAWAQEGDPSAAGIGELNYSQESERKHCTLFLGMIWKKKKKNGGGLKILKRNFKAQKSTFVLLFWNQGIWLWTQRWHWLWEWKAVTPGRLQLKCKYVKWIIVCNLKNDTLEVFFLETESKSWKVPQEVLAQIPDSRIIIIYTWNLLFKISRAEEVINFL